MFSKDEETKEDEEQEEQNETSTDADADELQKVAEGKKIRVKQDFSKIHVRMN